MVADESPHSIKDSVSILNSVGSIFSSGGERRAAAQPSFAQPHNKWPPAGRAAARRGAQPQTVAD